MRFEMKRFVLTMGADLEVVLDEFSTLLSKWNVRRLHSSATVIELTQQPVADVGSYVSVAVVVALSMQSHCQVFPVFHITHRCICIRFFGPEKDSHKKTPHKLVSLNQTNVCEFGIYRASAYQIRFGIYLNIFVGIVYTLCAHMYVFVYTYIFIAKPHRRGTLYVRDVRSKQFNATSLILINFQIELFLRILNCSILMRQFSNKLTTYKYMAKNKPLF